MGMWQGPPYQNGGGVQYPPSQQNQAGQGNSPGGSSISRGAAIGLFGGILAAIGDTLGAIGAAIAIEEARIESVQEDQLHAQFQQQLDDLKKQLNDQQEQQRQQQLDQIQKQIDGLTEKLNQQQSPDIERLNGMIELLIAKIGQDESS